MSTSSARHAMVLALAGALVFAACGGDDSSSSKTTASATSASTAATSAASTTAAPATTTAAAPTVAAPTTTTIDLTKNVPLKDVPGVTDTEIRYSAVGTDSNNPLGTCVLKCFMDGVNAYFTYRNSEGGIWGRKLVVTTTLDDALTQDQARSLDIVSANDTFGTFSAPFVASGWPDLAKAGIPTYTLAINPTQGQPELFGNSPARCYDCTQRPAAWIAKLAGAKKIASLGYGVSENSKLCAKSYKDSIDKYSAQIGGATVAYFNDALAFGLGNGIGPEVTAMKDAGVDLVLSCMDLNGMKTLAQELVRQGVRDKIKLVHANSYDQAYLKQANGLFDNDHVVVSFRPFEADAGSSQLQGYHEWMAKVGKAETEHSMIGWINADLAYEGLKRAGAEFDRKKVIEATNKITAFTAGGLVIPIDWTRQHVAPTEADVATHGPAQECVALVTVTAGAFKPSVDAAKPWQCWPGNTRDWSEPTATDFS